MKREIKLQDNYKEINEENVKLFEENGLNEDIVYTCTICGRKPSVSDSISMQGNNLICCRCVYDIFDGYAEAFKYMRHANR